MKPQHAWWEILFVLLVLLFLTLAEANAQGWQMTWTYDDAKLKAEGFKLYYGAVSQKAVKNPARDGTAKPYENVVTITPGAMRAWPLPIPAVGVYFYRMTTFSKDSAGTIVESAFSEQELSQQITPNPPVNLIVNSVTP